MINLKVDINKIYVNCLTQSVMKTETLHIYITTYIIRFSLTINISLCVKNAKKCVKKFIIVYLY